ncbi:hypothetical protein [Demequina sp. NBRC 110055]|uniref:hypothetical protein n=1 Tax=Demequina sp. NBRC 110055 TaxID=1570344 RepID=UPI000A00327F|nr:hypothetical protein [Demequina sp. NBRC 110055]
MAGKTREPRDWIIDEAKRDEFGSPLASFDEHGWVEPTSAEEQVNVLAAQEQHLIVSELRRVAIEFHYELSEREAEVTSEKNDHKRARRFLDLEQDVRVKTDVLLWWFTVMGTPDQLKKVFKGETALKNAQRIDLLAAHEAMRRQAPRRQTSKAPTELPESARAGVGASMPFSPHARLTDLSVQGAPVVHW